MSWRNLHKALRANKVRRESLSDRNRLYRRILGESLERRSMMAADVAEAIAEETDASKEVAEIYTMAVPVDEGSSDDVSELAFSSMLFDDSGLADIDGSEPIQIKAYSIGAFDESAEVMDFTPEMVMRTFSLNDPIDGVVEEVALFDESEIFATAVMDDSTSSDGAMEAITFDGDSEDNSPVIYYMMGSSANDEVEVQIQETSNDTDFHVMNFSTQNRWHNSSFPEDIDGNEIVSPSDVLILINVMNYSGRGAIGGIDLSAVSADQSYLDVNRDTVLSPIDALIVINYINSNPPGTESPNEDSDANSQASLFAPEVGRLAIVAGDERIDFGEEGSELWFTDVDGDIAEVTDADTSASRIAYTQISEDATEAESDAKVIDSVFEEDLSELLAI